MVSKRRVAKRTLTNPPKRSPALHGRRGGSDRSPLKGIAAVPSLVAASIDRSLRTCRRRLIRVFNRLVSLAACGGPATPSAQRKRRKQGFLLLNTVVPGDFEEDGGEAAEDRKEAGRAASPPPPPAVPGRRPLPPPACPGKRTLFLDLDETLVHSHPEVPPARYDFVVRPAIGGQVLTFYVAVRPGAQQLLAEAAERFEVVVFTAGLREYASLVLARLDPGGELIAHRLYRDSCAEVDGKLTKDLAAVGRDLSRAVIVDDNPNSYTLQPENAVPVRPFVDDLNDRELWRVMEFLAVAEGFEDTREAIKSFLCRGEEKAKEEEEPPTELIQGKAGVHALMQ